jgi:hypothetical protein
MSVIKNLKVERKLLGEDWENDAIAVMAAIRAFARRRPLHDDCRVVLFEVAGDRELHVNVTHHEATATPAGWSGPGVTRDGFVHNRRFGFADSGRIARHIQEMVYARPERVAARAGPR